MSLAHAGYELPSARAAARWRLPLGETRPLVRLAAPIMLIALVNMGMSLTDTAMVAAFFGTGALAAVAVGSDLYSIVFYLGAGVLGGLAPFYAAAVARADRRERAKLERIGWLTLGLVSAATVPVVWFAPAWLASLGLDPALLGQGAGYTRAMALTLIPMLGVALYRTLLTAAERPRLVLAVTLAMLPLNAVADYLLMIGPGRCRASGRRAPELRPCWSPAPASACWPLVVRRGVVPAAPRGRAHRLARPCRGAAGGAADRDRDRRRGRGLPRRHALRRDARSVGGRGAHADAAHGRRRLCGADGAAAGLDGAPGACREPRRCVRGPRRRRRQPGPVAGLRRADLPAARRWRRAARRRRLRRARRGSRRRAPP